MKKTLIDTKEKIRPLFIELSYKSPVSLFDKLLDKGSILLESVRPHAKIGRFSFVLFKPYKEFKVKNEIIELIDLDTKNITILKGKPLNILRNFVNNYRQESVEILPLFQGGIAGFFSYDFVKYLERVYLKAKDDLQIPDAHFFFYDKVFAFDHFQKKAYAIVCPGAKETVIDKSSYFIAKDTLIEMKNLYDNIPDDIDITPKFFNKKVEIIRELSKKDYIEMVKRAKEYIKAGDIFQANLSQRIFSPVIEEVSWGLYLILRQINPSPFAFYADFGSYKIVSSSPERLLRLCGKIAETRPIAGTRPRGATKQEDNVLRAELLLNEKERAEHIMLIDLERNDIGKVCKYGSVVVDELMITEDYSHVIHIVSNIKGILTQGKDAFSLVKAAFPGGTITGVPKVRCMEIIDELEPVARGPYTGSFGYIGFNGNMDLNIIIRTFIIKNKKAYVQVGAGIVADSDPEKEYYETLHKAEALLLSIQRI